MSPTLFVPRRNRARQIRHTGECRWQHRHLRLGPRHQPGINLTLIPAIVFGAINGLLLVRTKSVWPGVIVHAVNNGVATVVSMLFG
ncbi:CPBP family glutamic-type intramembrane protease [Saccharopolyspora sp. NPDC000995]